MKKILLSVVASFLLFGGRVSADEGMWLLPYLQKMNIKDMKAKGFKLSAQDIYNLNGNAIKDAIVIFGGGCTGEIVSPEGLLLTNHHCGFGAIQQHSSVDHDYLKNGFWAMNRDEEIPTPGLVVTFIREIVDVSDRILPQLNDKMTEKERKEKVKELSEVIIKEKISEGSTRKAIVKDFFGGNQYLMFVTEVYPDVRLVGAPPMSIGKFGGDTDNWMWPRHTGDFSMFRVYSDPEGRPAEYSKDNVPYKASKHLNISLKGYKPGDFAMIIGFPGSTERYMTSYEIDQTMQVDNPNRILIRGERQKLLMEDMMASDKVRIQYASKYASSSNYWKNSIGMNRGLAKLNVRAKKVDIENRFREWIGADPVRQDKYGEALPLIEEAVKERIPAMKTRQYLSEAFLRGTEIVGLAQIGRSLLRADSTKLDTEMLEELKKESAKIYKDYNMPTDRKVAKKMFALVRDSVAKEDLPSVYAYIANNFSTTGADGGEIPADIDRYVDYLYDRSLFATQGKFESFLANPDIETLKKDPAFMLAGSVIDAYNKTAPVVVKTTEKFNRGHRLFIAGLMEMEPEKQFYPDANFTMRLTYGQILPYRPQDGVIYDYYTTLDGVIAKEDPKNPYEFTVEPRLKELNKKKDFGPYAENGVLHVAFLSNNDITGGNSGSPIMNAKGELIGLAFDGNWEAMSGDIAFEPELQRTISVDIRYVLFIIDKYAKAGYLIDEMTLKK